MSVTDILNKLAEKQMIAGNDDLAFRLVEAADKTEKCHFCNKKAQMMKRKGKKDIHVCKECGKQTKCALKGCSAKMMYGEMIKRGEKAYCCSDCAKKDSKMKKTALDEMLEKYAKKDSDTPTLDQAKKELSPLGITIKKHEGEYCVNFKGGEEATAYYTDDLGDAIGTGKQMSKENKKTASSGDKGSLESKIKSMDGFVKMVGKGYGFETKSDADKALPVAEQGSGRYLNWKVSEEDGVFVLAVHGTDKESFINAADLLSKYAQSEDFGEYDGDDTEDTNDSMDLENADDSVLDHLSNIMADGYDAGKNDDDKCPYQTNTDEWFAWQAGWKAAVGERMPDYPEDFQQTAFGDNEGGSGSSSTLADLLNDFDKDSFSSRIKDNLVNYLKD